MCLLCWQRWGLLLEAAAQKGLASLPLPSPCLVGDRRALEGSAGACHLLLQTSELAAFHAEQTSELSVLPPPPPQ